MREIKFRAWDKERKELREVKLMDFSAWWVSTGSSWERGNTLEYGERNSFKNEETDRHILMQYTGIKDRNDKEINEGDIAKDAGTVYEILWVEKSAKFGAKVLKSKSVLCRDMTFPLQHYVIEGTLECVFEVIGNIYENPELLEVPHDR